MSEGMTWREPGELFSLCLAKYYIRNRGRVLSGHARRRSMWVLMMRTLVTRSSERVHNSFVRVPAVDAAPVPVLLLTLGLTLLPARAGAQTVSQAFANLFSGARLYPLVDAFP